MNWRIVTILLWILAGANLRAAVRFQLLASFDATNGSRPYGALVQGKDGVFYGTTAIGPWNQGNIFRVSAGHPLRGIFAFHGTNGGQPISPLTLGKDGNLYGTARRGGALGYGNAFRISRSGQFTPLLDFLGTNGAAPSSLMLANDGIFYGTTLEGPETGVVELGTVFRMTDVGGLTSLFQFNGDNGSQPWGGLVQGKDGDLYGVTMYGGTNGTNANGTVFRISLSGNLIWSESFNGTNGDVPTGGIVQARDGNFYGTTYFGGTNGNGGTIFRITPAGELATVYAFSNLDDGGLNVDGIGPSGTLVEGNDGALYGTTAYGGPNGAGTVFRITTSGSMNILYAFGTLKTVHGTPLDGNGLKFLTKAKDGSFYGTSTLGGFYEYIWNYELGTVFRFSMIRPVLIMAEIGRGWPLTSSKLVVRGKAKSREGIAGVFYQVNGGDWVQALTTNGWTNWTANISLSSGQNLFRAYALDAVGCASRTNTSKYLFFGGGASPR
jgi:uncharacterized repeat protein (TIGR03803 family)